MDTRTLRLFAPMVLVIGLGAFFFRLPDLSSRPLHTDEAVHALKFGELLESGRYTYNPREYHGPTHYYAALPLVWSSGARSLKQIKSVFLLRLSMVLFGVACVLALVLFHDAMGLAGVVVAGLLFALCPPFVYYSRYYIQEVPLVFFTLLMLGCAWRWMCSGRMRWAVGFGLAVGCMQATKETAPLALGALICGLLLAWFHTSRSEGELQSERMVRAPQILAAGVVAFFTAATILTGFWTRPVAALDMFAAYTHYLPRAGSGDSSALEIAAHRHPWHWYWRMLLGWRYQAGPWWSQAPIMLLGLVGMATTLRRAPGTTRTLVFRRALMYYTLILSLVYTLIPYKTPWLVLSFLHGWVLLAGIGVQCLWEHTRRSAWRVPLALGLLVVLAWSGHQSRLAMHQYPASPRNPWVYAHTGTDLLRLVERVDKLAAVRQERLRICVVIPDSDYWPLPWYLRSYPDVGYWSEVVEIPECDVLITTPALSERLVVRDPQGWTAEIYGLRPGVMLELRVRENLWREFMETRR